MAVSGRKFERFILKNEFIPVVVVPVSFALPTFYVEKAIYKIFRKS